MFETLKTTLWDGNRKYVSIGAIVAAGIMWAVGGDFSAAMAFFESLVN